MHNKYTMRNNKIIGSFLILFCMCFASAISLNSCAKDAEEPFWGDKDIANKDDKEEDEGEGDKDSENNLDPGNSEDNDSKDDQEENKDDQQDQNSGDNDEVPDAYKYPLSYVILPEGTPQQVKEYTGFTLNFNKDNHTANYVAWELLASETSGSIDRNDYSYWVDNSLEGCLSTDFAYSTYGYERGHMCPAADQKWSAAAMNDSMVMANMCPQYRSLNSGLWGTLENMERTWAKRDKAIWIIAGPLYYATDDLYIGKAKARVASAYFKAFLLIDSDNPRAIAFVFQNGSNPGNIEDYAMSIDELEEETGYDFFPALPDDIENAVEATYSFSDWNK